MLTVELSNQFFSILSFIVPDFLALRINNNYGLQMIGAALALLGIVGGEIGQGIAANGACKAIGRNPDSKKKIVRTLIWTSALIQSGVVAAIAISLVLIFVA